MNARRLTVTASGSRRDMRHLALPTLAVLAAVVGAMAFGVAPALAAAPETPTLTVAEPVHATTATFLGILNPGTLAQPPQSGTYKFLYKAGTGTECEGGSESSSGLSFGNAPEPLSPETVTGLNPNTEYAVCLSVTNLESPSQTTVSAPVPFKTTVPPETPETTEPAAQITATSAILEGTLNPHGTVTTKAGGYFAYSNPGGSSCTEGPTVGLEGVAGELEGKALPVHATVGLEPDRTYKVCLVATNEFGNATVGNEVVLETLAPAPEVVAGAASYSNATPFEATLHAEANAEDQETTVYFQYSTSPVLAGKSLATPTDVPAAPGNSIGAGFGNVGVEAATGPVLTAGTVYYYQAVAINPTGTTYGTVEHFETLGVPVVQTSAAEEVTAASAELGGKLDAGGEAEYYVEYGTEPCSAITMTCGTKSTPVHVSGKVQQCTLGGVLQECVTPIAVTGLEPGRTYHYWLVATNAAASEPVHGAAEEFTTKPAAPTVQTGRAADVTETSVTLTGELNPGAGEAEYYVEYVLPTDVIERSATGFASGRTLAGVGPIVLSGLQPNTTYYYWLAAKSAAVSEPVRGETLQFTTPRSQAELEAQAAANRKPAEELAAANAAKQKLEEEAERATETAAAANAAKQKQYDEIAVETVSLVRQEAEAGKRSTRGEKAKPKPASCRKGFMKKKTKCVPKKSKKKGKVKK